MVRNRAPKLLLPLAALVACAGLAIACGLGDSLDLPGTVSRGVVADDHFYAVTTGKLIGVNLKKQVVRDFGAPAPKLSAALDVLGGKALVASPGKAHVIDLTSGKEVRSAPFPGTALSLGLIDADRAFIHTGSAVVLRDLAKGKTLRTINVGLKLYRPAIDPRSSVPRRMLTAQRTRQVSTCLTTPTVPGFTSLHGRFFGSQPLAFRPQPFPA